MPELPILLADWTMSTLYFGCAVLGGAVVLLQVVLGLFGLGGDELDAADGLDAADSLDAADGADAGMHMFSVRAVAGFFVMFGLVGWGGSQAGWSPLVTLAIAGLAGVTTLLLVAWLLSLQTKLDASGNVDPREAVGLTARVYLRIPGSGSGNGKITVEVGGRALEFEAFTSGDELPTGSQVRVERMTAPGLFEVTAL